MTRNNDVESVKPIVAISTKDAAINKDIVTENRIFRAKKSSINSIPQCSGVLFNKYKVTMPRPVKNFLTSEQVTLLQQALKESDLPHVRERILIIYSTPKDLPVLPPAVF